MKALLLFFAARQITAAGIVFCAASGAIIVLNTLGASPMSVAALGLLSLYLLPIYLYLFTVPMNLSWVLTLPLRKRSILHSQALLSIFGLILTGIHLIGLAAVYTLTSSQSSRLPLWLKTTSSPGNLKDSGLLERIGSFVDSAVEWNPQYLQNMLLGLTTLAVALIFVAPKQIPGSLRRNNQLKPGPIAGLAGAAILAFVFRHQLDTPLVTAAILFLVGGTALRSTLLRVAFGRSHRRRWLAIYGIWSVLVLSTCAAAAVAGLSSDSPRIRINSILYLGPWSARFTRDGLSEYLALDLSAEQIHRVGDALRERYFLGKPISNPATLRLDWSAAIASKSRKDSLDALVAQFDARWLAPLMLRAFLDRRAELAPEDLPGSGSIRFFPKELKSGDAVAFISSRKPHLIRFALVWSRYFGDRAVLRAILKSSPSFGDEERLRAVETLSILTGERLTLDSLENKRITQRLSVMDPGRCSELQPLPAQEGLMNFCIRREWFKIRKGLDVYLPEAAGWIDFPLDDRERTLVKALLAKPN